MKALYKQLYEKIRNDIETGQLKHGQKITGDYETMQEYLISRITVRQAMELLKNDGLITRKKGRYGGTYVV